MMRRLKLTTRQEGPELLPLLRRAHHRQRELSVLRLPATPDVGLHQRPRQLEERRPKRPTAILPRVLRRPLLRESPLHRLAPQSLSSGHLLRSQKPASSRTSLPHHRIAHEHSPVLPLGLLLLYPPRRPYQPKTNLWEQSSACHLHSQATACLLGHHLHLQVADLSLRRLLRGTPRLCPLHYHQRHQELHFRHRPLR